VLHARHGPGIRIIIRREWPPILLAVHFFFTKSACVDDRWVEEREDDLRMRSYDLSHIADLEERIASRHPSVHTPEERER
jgi:hypothetical protein